jgi:hypothetical protein
MDNQISNPPVAGSNPASCTSFLDFPAEIERPQTSEHRPKGSVEVGVEGDRGGRVVQLSCRHCGAAFTRPYKRRHAKFCSPACAYTDRVGKPAPGFVTPDSTRRERIAANGLVNKRLKLGWFKKPTTCTKCGRTARLDSHHTDYSKPERVYWLCRSCHTLAHRDERFLRGVAPFIADRHAAKGVA